MRAERKNKYENRCKLPTAIHWHAPHLSHHHLTEDKLQAFLLPYSEQEDFIDEYKMYHGMKCNI
jgi:hypothetical protein